MTSPIAPISIIFAVLLLVPVPWLLHRASLSLISLNIWLFMTCLILGIDAVVWKDNIDVFGEGWCDFSTKLLLGAQYAIPATCLSIAIHLEQDQAALIKFGQTVASTMWRRIFEGIMCFGVPVLAMILHVIVQDRRYDIVAGLGCRAATFFSVPSIFILWIPPFLLTLATLGFLALALRRLFIYRATCRTNLTSPLTCGISLRLLSLCAVEATWLLVSYPASLLLTGQASTLQPWNTWAEVHQMLASIGVFSASSPLAKLHSWDSSSILVMTAVFLVFLGLEAFDAFRSRDADFDNSKEWSTKLSGERHWARWAPKKLHFTRKNRRAPPKPLLTLAVKVTSTTERFPPISPSPRKSIFGTPRALRFSFSRQPTISITTSRVAIPPVPSTSTNFPSTSTIQMPSVHQVVLPLPPRPMYTRPRPQNMGGPVSSRPTSL